MGRRAAPAPRATRRPRSGRGAGRQPPASSRVLPVPPVPMSVTSRWRPMSVATSASSFSRPTKLVSWTGRFDRRVLSERSGGNATVEVVDDDLVDLLGPVDVAEAVRAEVHELDRRREPITGEDGRDRGADDLAAVRDGEDPRHAIERRDRSSPRRAPRRRPRGAPSGRAAGRSRPRSHRAAPAGRRSQRRWRRRVGEDRQHPVAGRLDHGAAMRVDARAQEPIVLGERRAHPCRRAPPRAACCPRCP